MVDFPVNMMIFHSYVILPEGKSHFPMVFLGYVSYTPNFTSQKVRTKSRAVQGTGWTLPDQTTGGRRAIHSSPGEAVASCSEFGISN